MYRRNVHESRDYNPEAISPADHSWSAPDIWHTPAPSPSLSRSVSEVSQAPPPTTPAPASPFPHAATLPPLINSTTSMKSRRRTPRPPLCTVEQKLASPTPALMEDKILERMEKGWKGSAEQIRRKIKIKKAVSKVDSSVWLKRKWIPRESLVVSTINRLVKVTWNCLEE